MARARLFALVARSSDERESVRVLRRCPGVTAGETFIGARVLEAGMEQAWWCSLPLR